MITEMEALQLAQERLCPALLLNSEQDCTLLARAIGPEETARYEGWSDNGGDPDGTSWLLWRCDDMLLAHASRLGIAHKVVRGFELPYPRALRDAYAKKQWPLHNPWSGISSNECIFVTNEHDAARIMHVVHEYMMRYEGEGKLPDDLLEQLLTN